MSSPLLSHAEIAALVPHAGTMCLLDSVVAWDADHIECLASSHTAAHNPLRTESGLLATAAIEYAAQAMAVHGGLLARSAGRRAAPGFLASARSVQLQRLRLDDLPGVLRVTARREAGNAQQILYAFSVSHDGAAVADGRCAVVLDSPLRP